MECDTTKTNRTQQVSNSLGGKSAFSCATFGFGIVLQLSICAARQRCLVPCPLALQGRSGSHSLMTIDDAVCCNYTAGSKAGSWGLPCPLLDLPKQKIDFHDFVKILRICVAGWRLGQQWFI